MKTAIKTRKAVKSEAPVSHKDTSSYDASAGIVTDLLPEDQVKDAMQTTQVQPEKEGRFDKDREKA